MLLPVSGSASALSVEDCGQGDGGVVVTHDGTRVFFCGHGGQEYPSDLIFYDDWPPQAPDVKQGACPEGYDGLRLRPEGQYDQDDRGDIAICLNVTTRPFDGSDPVSFGHASCDVPTGWEGYSHAVWFRGGEVGACLVWNLEPGYVGPVQLPPEMEFPTDHCESGYIPIGIDIGGGHVFGCFRARAGPYAIP